MMTSYVILTTVLIISLILNAIFYWYSRQVVTKLTFIYDNIGDMSELVSNYQVHLKSVYQMEMFYGDETLQHLMNHTKSLSLLLEDYEDPEFFVERFEEVPPTQEELPDAQTPLNEENVFYAGTRRSDN
mgnify:FL=1